MQNKHKLWLLIVAVLILIVGAYAYIQPSSTPAVILTNNSSDSSTDPISYYYNKITGGTGDNNKTQNPKPTQTQMKPCPTCKATGVVTCPKCNGDFKWKECPNCHDIVPYDSPYTGCGCTLKSGGYYTHYLTEICECGDGKITCPECNGAKKVPA